MPMRADCIARIGWRRPAHRRVSREQLETLTRPLLDRTLAARAQGAARRARAARATCRAWSWSAAPRACRRCAARWASSSAQSTSLHQCQSRRGGGPGRGDPGQRAGRQCARRRAAAARRDPAVAGHRDHGRPGRAHRRAQHHHSGGQGAGVHHLPGRPDGDGHPRGAGRARAGGRLPLAGALRAARHPADGGRRGAHPRQLPGRRRRPCSASRRGDRQRAWRPAWWSSPATAWATTRSRRCCATASPMPQDDMQLRALREARVDADRCCWPRSRRWMPTATCCPTPTRRHRRADAAAARHWPPARTHDAINAAVEALAKGTEDFAAARMNRGIRQALAGRSIEDVWNHAAHPHPAARRATARWATISRPRRAPRSARRCSKTASPSSMPAR